MIEYEQLNHALRSDAAGMEAAELHGSLCAQAALGRGQSVGDWLDVAFGDQVAVGDLEQGLGEALVALHQRTWTQLGDSGFSFELYLPDEEAALEDRTRAVASWCAGYLGALGMCGIDPARDLSGDARDFVEDVARLASAHMVEDTEAEATALSELEEYLRVGAVLVFETLRGPGPEDSVQ